MSTPSVHQTLEQQMKAIGTIAYGDKRINFKATFDRLARRFDSKRAQEWYDNLAAGINQGFGYNEVYLVELLDHMQDEYMDSTATPTCDYCHAPKAADGSRFCCADHFYRYQIAVAASLPPTTITVTTMRERKEGRGA